MKALEKRLAKVEAQGQGAVYLWREMNWTEAEFQERAQNAAKQHSGREIIWIGWKYSSSEGANTSSTKNI